MLMAFESAARCGSFTAAAQELNLTQGAISRQVSALETRLNITLLDLPIKSAEGDYLMTPTHRASYAPTIALRKWLVEQTAIED